MPRIQTTISVWFLVLHVKSIFNERKRWIQSLCSLKRNVCPCLFFPCYFKVLQTKATCHPFVSLPSLNDWVKFKHFSCAANINKRGTLKETQGLLTRQGTSGTRTQILRQLKYWVVQELKYWEAIQKLLSEKALLAGSWGPPSPRHPADEPCCHKGEQVGEPTEGIAGDSHRPAISSLGASASSPGGITLCSRAGLLVSVPGALLPPSGCADF